ncbi:MAG: DUF2523 domain-containing protein [Pseudohongiella sp.]|nr:DUF2523 domain-containing protein [Pseudohongiella sp.]
MWGTVLTWLTTFAILKVIAVLAIGTITFVGYQTIMSDLEAQMVLGWSGIAADALAYLAISGVTDGFGIILGALSIRAVIVFAPKIGKLLSI